MSTISGVTVAELARVLAGRLEGNGEQVVRAIGLPEIAGRDMISWIAGAADIPLVHGCSAAALLVPRDLRVPGGVALIRVADIDAALAIVADWLEAAHARATVHDAPRPGRHARVRRRGPW